MNLRNAFIEKRLKLLHIDCLERELLRVERNNQTGKITHPENSGDGHGDGADGLAGAYYNAVLHEDEYSDQLTTLHMLSPVDTELDKEQLLKIAAGIPDITQEMRQEVLNQQSQTAQEINKSSSGNKLSNWIL